MNMFPSRLRPFHRQRRIDAWAPHSGELASHQHRVAVDEPRPLEAVETGFPQKTLVDLRGQRDVVVLLPL